MIQIIGHLAATMCPNPRAADAAHEVQEGVQKQTVVCRAIVCRARNR